MVKHQVQHQHIYKDACPKGSLSETKITINVTSLGMSAKLISFSKKSLCKSQTKGKKLGVKKTSRLQLRHFALCLE